MTELRPERDSKKGSRKTFYARWGCASSIAFNIMNTMLTLGCIGKTKRLSSDSVAQVAQAGCAGWSAGLLRRLGEVAQVAPVMLLGEPDRARAGSLLTFYKAYERQIYC